MLAKTGRRFSGAGALLWGQLSQRNTPIESIECRLVCGTSAWCASPPPRRPRGTWSSSPPGQNGLPTPLVLSKFCRRFPPCCCGFSDGWSLDTTCPRGVEPRARASFTIEERPREPVLGVRQRLHLAVGTGFLRGSEPYLLAHNPTNQRNSVPPFRV